MYVLCTNNKPYIRFKNEPSPDEELIDLTVGHIYKALPDAEAERSGTMRVIDNSGEDYLYPADYFEPIALHGLSSDVSDSLTVHVDSLTKSILRAEALTAGMSMSALVRSWIDEHLMRKATETTLAS